MLRDAGPSKRLARDGAAFKLGLKQRGVAQFGDLLRTAEQFAVPAIYAVYTGGMVFRAGRACSHRRAPNCFNCRRMAISIISAYELSSVLWSPRMAAGLVYSDSIPLEDLVDPAHVTQPVMDVNLGALSGDLLKFLREDQTGPREIAKRIFAAVARHRLGAFSAVTPELTLLAGEPIFPEVPQDSGHFSGPYYAHNLQGLRRARPAYVQDLLAGWSPPSDLADRVAGVVLITR